jgi:hypothetical protein
MTVHFTVYSRARCHLCDVLVGELRAATAGRDVAIQIVDVDGDDRLRDAYGLDVPVLTADGEEICRHRLDPSRLHAWLEAARQEAGGRGRSPV